MESWQQAFHQLDNEPEGTVLVVAGPHNGDATWATPHLRMLREYHKGARLVLACPNGVADIFAHNPLIDRFALIENKAGNLQKFSVLASESRKFSIVVPPASIWPLEHQFNMLRTEQYLTRRGYVVTGLRPDLYISTLEMDLAVEFMAKYRGGPRFMVECFSYSSQTAYNMDWFNWTVKYITEKWPDAWFFVPCSAKEQPRVPVHPRVVTLSQFTIRQCGFLVNFCNYMLSCSSGVSHACSSTLAKTQIGWLETVNHEWHSTKPYNLAGRKYHVGVDVDEYFRLLHELLT